MGALPCTNCNRHSVSAHLTLTGESGSVATPTLNNKEREWGELGNGD